jgi:hypothetical protein
MPWTLIDLYRQSLRRRLSQAEQAWVEEQREAYPYLTLPHLMLARQEPMGQTLFRAAVYAPVRSQLRQYVKGRLFWTGTAHSASDLDAMPDHTSPAPTAAHVPSLFQMFSLSPTLPASPEPTFGVMASSPRQGLFHAYLHQLCVEQQCLAAQVRATLLKQMATLGAAHDASPAVASTAMPEQYYSRPAQVAAVSVPRPTHAQQLIDRFLEQPPTPRRANGQPSQQEGVEHQSARASNAFDETLATETLARLYLGQGNRVEAIRVYQQLCLRFPEKSDYFEAQIHQLSHS